MTDPKLKITEEITSAFENIENALSRIQGCQNELYELGKLLGVNVSAGVASALSGVESAFSGVGVASAFSDVIESCREIQEIQFFVDNDVIEIPSELNIKTDCEYYSGEPLLKCAINPSKPCSECSYGRN